MKYVPAAVSDRDGYGHVLGVEVAGGKIRTSVPILAADDALVGEVTPDDRSSGGGIVHWDPSFRPGIPIAASAGPYGAGHLGEAFCIG